MQPIKAIVLTFDKYRAFTDHMIMCYGKLWPSHPYVFQVPYQDLPPTQEASAVEYHQCPSDIKGTVLALLEPLGDEEWIYWCIDDKYPIEIDPKKVQEIHNWLFSKEAEGISGLLFCRCRGLVGKKNLTGNQLAGTNGDVYLERENYSQIWIHQYLKVKVLRHLFSSFPDEIATAKAMDYLIQEVKKPDSHRIYVTSNTMGVAFGESASRGVMTKNCYESFKENNLQIPSWVSETTPHELVMRSGSRGTFSRIVNRLKKCFS